MGRGGKEDGGRRWATVESERVQLTCVASVFGEPTVPHARSSTAAVAAAERGCILVLPRNSLNVQGDRGQLAVRLFEYRQDLLRVAARVAHYPGSNTSIRPCYNHPDTTSTKCVLCKTLLHLQSQSLLDIVIV